MLGLSWSDIDFKAKRINLWRQIRYIIKRGYFFMSLKTESSNRYILVDDILLSELRRWQAQQAENERSHGGSYVYIYREADGHIEKKSKSLPAPDSGKVPLVCTRDNGNFVLQGGFMRILRSAGLNTHSFRHTHVVQLIEGGATPKGVACRVGHANAAITQNLYTPTHSNYKRKRLRFSIKICRQSDFADNRQTYPQKNIDVI